MNALGTDWMRQLAAHYESLRRQYPDDDLMIVFDIDGTILDMRYPILSLLRAYDRAHGTCVFRRLCLAEIRDHESHIEDLLHRLEVPRSLWDGIREFYDQRFWNLETLLEAHRPFHGVLEVIRWFQLQPNTEVGLNSGRPEELRAETLTALNRLGAKWKVEFADRHLALNPYGWEQAVRCSKAEGLQRFSDAGYRIFAFVDNEPENLLAAAAVDPRGEILLLHADTIFRSGREHLPTRAVSGTDYDLNALLYPRTLSGRFQLV
jgi:hypothetical protein